MDPGLSCDSGSCILRIPANPNPNELRWEALEKSKVKAIVEEKLLGQLRDDHTKMVRTTASHQQLRWRLSLPGGYVSR